MTQPGPFDQHQHHQVHVSKISTFERDTLGLYTVYISNLDPTWRILFEHLHLKGTILIFEIGPKLRWVDFFLSFFLFALFCAFYYFYVPGNGVDILHFYKWKLNKEKKNKLWSVTESAAPFGIIYLKGYSEIPIDVKQRDGNAILISLMLLLFEYRSIASWLLSIWITKLLQP